MIMLYCQIVNGIFKKKHKKTALGQSGIKISQNDFAWLGCDTSHPCQMIDIQYGITIMSGREVSRPYRVWFFAEGERFLSFWRCHRPRKRAALVMWCG